MRMLDGNRAKGYTETKQDDLWRIGNARIHGKDYTVMGKVFDEPSKYGINGGRISKLSVWPKEKNWSNSIINYDRGWDIEPKGHKAKKILNEILNYYK